MSAKEQETGTEGGALPVPAAPQPPEVTMRQVVAHYRKADSVVMRVVNQFGGMVETGLNRLPGPAKRSMESAVGAALRRAYDICGTTTTRGHRRGWSESDLAHRSVAAVTGAVGGFFGTAGLAEMPVAVVTILRSIRSVARDYGFDPDDPQIAKECIAVFASGGPLKDDDGLDSAFLAARMAMNGARIERIIGSVAGRLTSVLSQKLGSQAVPVLGAFGGATVNFAFMNFYTEMAHVYFGLRRMAEDRGQDDVLAEFRRAIGRD